jgi:tRNA pseudouridine55 synthase
MNWFYLIDKPLWISSFDIIRKLRKKLNIRRIWHTWTLDPLATWGVILAVWNYTKLISYLEKDKKTYDFTINLDWTTDSFDLAEEIYFLDKNLQEKYKKELTREKIWEVLKKYFSWEITQIPPKYSALKINWKRAYELARAWEDVKMKSRLVTISHIEILDFTYPKLTLSATVSAWTYIRSIASELGEVLWTGWYITGLRRTKISNLDINIGQSLDSFDESKTLDLDDLFWAKLSISLDDSVLKKINNWLEVIGDFDYPIWESLFVTDWTNITNIVMFDWKCLYAKKKV